MKRTFPLLMVLSMLVALAIPASLVAQGQRGGIPTGPQIPGNQRVCNPSGQFFTTSIDYVPVPGFSATFNFGLFTSANVIAQFSAESGVTDTGSRLDIAYGVDGGPATVFGPEFFAMNFPQGFLGFDGLETHTNISVIPISGGFFSSHTIQVFARVEPVTSGVSAGTIFFGCLTLEGGTS